MGQYKVPQDVEAEDKIIGFMTLKQFIYAVIGVAYGFLTFQLFGGFLPLFLIIGAPPTILMLLLGLWQRQGQPFESYFLALVNYTMKPRRRLWVKEPIIEAFKIETPKVTIEHSQRSPQEVRGQLERLAQLVDTRGWAAKQPEVQEPQLAPAIDLKERIAVAETTEPEPVADPAMDVHLSDDILDFKNNPSAQNLNVLIQDAERSIRDEAKQKMMEKSAAGKNTSAMTPKPSADILKIALDGGDLKVSHIASKVNRQDNLQEGQSVSLRNES